MMAFSYTYIMYIAHGASSLFYRPLWFNDMFLSLSPSLHLSSGMVSFTFCVSIHKKLFQLLYTIKQHSFLNCILLMHLLLVYVTMMPMSVLMSQLCVVVRGQPHGVRCLLPLYKGLRLRSAGHLTSSCFTFKTCVLRYSCPLQIKIWSTRSTLSRVWKEKVDILTGLWLRRRWQRRGRNKCSGAHRRADATPASLVLERRNGLI